MFRFILMIFGLPWPVLVLLACGLFGLGHYSKQQALSFEAEKAQALVEGQPEPVPLDQFEDGDVHPADEVHVTTWINVAHNYELTLQKRGADTVRRMFVLFGPGDGMDSSVARGVVVIHPDSVDRFLAVMIAGMVGEEDGKLLFNLNGKREASPDLSSMVNDALADRGLHKAADFLVVEPYLDGREAALKPDAEAPESGMQLFGTLGAVLLVLALKNFATGRRTPAPQRSLADVEIPPVGTPILPQGAKAQPSVAPAPMPAAPPPIASSEGWSPLEAVRARQAERMTAAMAPPPPPSQGVSGTDLAAGLFQKDRERSGGLGPVQKFAGALALYFVVYLAFGQFTGPSSMNTVEEGGMAAAMMESFFGMGVGEEPEVPEAVRQATDGTAAAPAEAAPVADAEVAAAPLARTGGATVSEDAGPSDLPQAGGGWLDAFPQMPPALVLPAMAGGGVLIVALGIGALLMQRRSGGQGGASRGRDPYDRLSERLR